MTNLRTNRRTARALLGVAALFSPIAATADEPALDLKPGKWEIRSEATVPMFGAPKSTLQTVCMKDNNPIPFMVKGPCRSEDRVLKDGVLTWKVACDDKDGVSISGKGELRAEEPGFRGVTDIDVVVGEKKIATKSNWIGKRVGDCDPEKEKPASK